uniref:Uncharacterized protein n=1 Tax=Odontella aurita TaxID=265563 RepID=A0A7S4IZE0_9STRA|mmetsp:Transcript_33824/g.100924  ORF Transcript_33824/g.100924 Transcript_33824/m.100924 type:complete len:322 (+) Transcript_33824:712-1677(+)
MPLRIPAAAFVSFGATLFPVLCVLDYGYMRFSYVADRFAYLAAIAPISAFAVGIVEGCQRLFVVPRSPSSSSSSSSSKMVPWNGTVTRAPPVLRALTSVLLAILATLTYRHASIYTTEENFYRHVVTHNPNARSMWLNLGNAYMRQERNAEAADCYATSYEQNPSQDKLHTNYGIVLSKLGRIEEAAAMLERGLESEEKTPGGLKRNLNELGNAMSKLGRYDDATAYFRRALEIDPMYAIGWNNLGNDLYRAGRPEDAVDAYRRAFGIDPNYAKARNNCAIVLGTLNRHGEEAELWRSILSVDPDNADAERRLEAALAKIV